MNPADLSCPVNVSPCIAEEYKFSFNLRFYQSVLNRHNLKRSQVQIMNNFKQAVLWVFKTSKFELLLGEKLCFENNASLLDNNTHVLWKAETCWHDGCWRPNMAQSLNRSEERWWWHWWRKWWNWVFSTSLNSLFIHCHIRENAGIVLLRLTQLSLGIGVSYLVVQGLSSIFGNR